MGLLQKIASKRSSLKTSNAEVTVAAQLTLRQSLWPLTIVTTLFFLWVRMRTHSLSFTAPLKLQPSKE